MRASALCFLAPIMLGLACGTTTSVSKDAADAAADASGPGVDAGADSSVVDASVRKDAEGGRPVAFACSKPRPAGNAMLTEAGPGVSCLADSECVNGADGRCTYSVTSSGVGMFPSQACTYSTCTTDSQCSSDKLCQCDDLFGHGCVTAACRVNADCAGSLPCSPSTVQMTGDGEGYYCHTSADPCFVDADCPSVGGQGRCVYRVAAKVWACTVELPRP
jgi:hypothetical protein